MNGRRRGVRGKAPVEPGLNGSPDARTAETAYATGLVHEAMGEKEKAHKAWEIASSIDRGEQRRSGNARLLKRSITRCGQGQALEEARTGRGGESDLPRARGNRSQVATGKTAYASRLRS